MLILDTDSDQLMLGASPIGEVGGTRFYRVQVVAIETADQIALRLESEWQTSPEATLIRMQAELAAAHARIAELERRRGAKPAKTNKPGRSATHAATEPPPAIVAPAPDSLEITPARATPEFIAASPRPGMKRPFEEAIAPTRPAPARTVAAPERHPCPQCGRIFDSVDSYNRHVPRCAPAPVVVETPPDPAPAIVIPEDPDEAAAELARLSAGAYPRPCPECWAHGYVTMVKGPAGMASHRKTAHGVLPNIGTPVPVRWPDGSVCKHCGSGVFARSFDDDTVCVRCAKEGPPPAAPTPSGRRKVASSA